MGIETIEDQAKRKNLLSVTVVDGKYTVIQNNKGCLTALRYGEEWRDCCGDGLILALAQEVAMLRQKVEDVKNSLIGAGMADPSKARKITLAILDKA